MGVAAVAVGGAGVGLGVGVGVNVAVAVAVGVGVVVGGVAVGVGVEVGVGRGLGAAERLPSTIRPHAPAAKHAITMNRLIPRKKGLAVMLEGLVSPGAAKSPVQQRKKTRSFMALLRKRRDQVPEIEDFFDSWRFQNCPVICK